MNPLRGLTWLLEENARRHAAKMALEPEPPPYLVAEQQRKAWQDPDAPVQCPRCSSKFVNVGRKGYGPGKAILGTCLLGPFGLFLGFAGRNDLRFTCLKCSHVFKPIP